MDARKWLKTLEPTIGDLDNFCIILDQISISLCGSRVIAKRNDFVLLVCLIQWYLFIYHVLYIFMHCEQNDSPLLILSNSVNLKWNVSTSIKSENDIAVWRVYGGQFGYKENETFNDNRQRLKVVPLSRRNSKSGEAVKYSFLIVILTHTHIWERVHKKCTNIIPWLL